MVELTTQQIDTTALVSHVRSKQAGAVLLFMGTVREITEGRRTAWLDYECYPEMAERKLKELETEMRRRWPIVQCAIVHRLGHLEVGEASVAIAVSSPHRQQAFQAGSWMIDSIKQVVPIWKKDNWADGTSQWVHPRVEPSPEGD